MENLKIAQIFREMADILELMGENRFRYLAYRRAAQTIEHSSQEMRQMADENPKKLLDLPGVGQGLADKIVEILHSGDCREHQMLLAGFKTGLLELLTVRGLGPKKVKKFYTELGIDSLSKLKHAAETGLLAKLPGMGEKSQAGVVQAIKDHEKHSQRLILHAATEMADRLVVHLKTCPVVDRVEYAGSCRRKQETVGDIDILVTWKTEKDHARIVAHFVTQPDVRQILAHGETKASVILESANGPIQSDLRVVDESSFGAALHYFTGSKAHNIAMRKLAISKGFKLNEYGLFKGEKKIAGKTEKSIFKALGLPYIIPELRRDEGEIDAALNHTLPHPVELSDIQGDLHMHTRESDGGNTLEEMVAAAQALGYRYIGITEHSTSLRVASGLDENRLIDHLRHIDSLNKKLRNFRILKSAEVDILEDGRLDYPDEILKKLDFVNISVHTKMNLPSEQQTARVLKAMANPYVSVLCHPTGRIVNDREPYPIDLIEIARAAKKYRVALEISSSLRLDLNEGNCRLAHAEGAKFVINTDSHRTESLNSMQFGVAMARRGWLEKKDILNTLPVEKLLAYFRKK